MVKYKQYKKYTCETCGNEFEEYFFKRFCCNDCRIFYKYGNLVGQKFNRLTAVEIVKKDGRQRYRCVCDCGKETIVGSAQLKKGSTKSCGCYREASFNRLYDAYIKSAKDRNYSFDIDRINFRNITSQPCYYCGVEPQKEACTNHDCNGYYIYNGLDRVDNTKGYSLDNVVPCCELCNRLKKAMIQDDFISHIHRISDYQRSSELKLEAA